MAIAFKVFLSSLLLWMIFGWLSYHKDELELLPLAYKICLIVAGVSIIVLFCSIFAMIWLF